MTPCLRLAPHSHVTIVLPTKIRIWFWVAILVFFGVGRVAAADSGHVLSGHITEADGQPISGAHAQLDSAETQSDSSGSYSLSGLSGGSHTLTISASGHRPRTLTLDLTEDKTTLPAVTLDAENVVVMEKMTEAEHTTAASSAFADKVSSDSVTQTISGAALTH